MAGGSNYDPSKGICIHILMRALRGELESLDGVSQEKRARENDMASSKFCTASSILVSNVHGLISGKSTIIPRNLELKKFAMPDDVR
jgi:hypothetical protein